MHNEHNLTQSILTNYVIDVTLSITSDMELTAIDCSK